MTTPRRFAARVAALFRTRASDARLEEEIAEHIALATEDNLARGMTPDEARVAALRSFGGVLRTTETYRETRDFAAIDALRQDLRAAWRSYRKSPSFALVALITLTLAIGANTAIFSLLNALVLRNLPVRDPDGLVQLTTSTRTSPQSFLTYRMLQAVARDQRVFSAVMGWWGLSGLHVDTGNDTTTALVAAASGNLFDELGVRPVAGRLLEAADMSLDPPSARPVVVVGHTFWLRHFHGDAAIVGREIRIDTQLFTIVGIAPPGFTGFTITAEPDLTVPLTAAPLLSARPVSSLLSSASLSFLTVGRLRPGLTLEQARAQLSTIWPAVREAALPPDYAGARRTDFLATRLSVTSAATGNEASLRRQFTRPLAVVLGIAMLILVIACVNLASLLLSRAAARSHEIGVRLALGASRWRIARQMLVEGVLLSIAGGACGVVVATWTCRALTGLIFEEWLATVVFDARPDLRVVAATFAIAVVVGAFFSVMPAWRATRRSAVDALQQNRRTATASGRAGRLLVAIQVALTLVLLATAGVLVRSLAAARAIATGIERTDNVFVAYPWGRAGGFAGVDNDVYYPELLGRVAALPGVRAVSASLYKPGTSGTIPELVAPSGESAVLERGISAERTPVAPGFFGVVGIRMVRGRDFTWRDDSRAGRVAIVSESLARRLFGDREPIGQRLRAGLQADRPEIEVIGVVADARLYNVKQPNLIALFTPALQDPQANYKCLVIRGTGVSVEDVRRAVEGLGREDLNQMVTLRYISERALLQDRLTAMFSTFFGALALLLAAIGVYGLMSYTVEQRWREIGIRVALGADSRRVVGDVIRDGIAVTLAGAAAGFAVALAAVQLVKSLLFGVAPYDPVTLAAAPASLLAIAVAACVLPARRAARVDPIIALRAE